MYSLSPGIPGMALKLRQMTPGRSCIGQMLAVALPAMFTSELHHKGRPAIEIMAGIDCLLKSRGLPPCTQLVHALAAYNDTMGGRPLL